jgi:hypothetical protein
MTSFRLVLFATLLAGFVSAPFPVCGQIVVESARLEILQLESQYRDASGLAAARGFEDGLLEFTVEFENAFDVDEVQLRTPSSLLLNSERQGNAFVSRAFIGPVSTLLRGIYRIEVTSSTGAFLDFEFEVETLDFPDFPEVEFPYDGQDQADAEELRAEWDGQADTDRVDLFEIRPDLFGNHPELAELLATWRTTTEDVDLENELFENRRYEIWIGSTYEDSVFTDFDFDVDIWLTSSRYLRFTTGPDARHLLDGFSPNERIDSAVAGVHRKRVGNLGPISPNRTVATLEGNNLAEAEVSPIGGSMDATLQGEGLVEMEEISEGRLFTRTVPLNPGQYVLFLAEFSPSHRLGSEIARVSQAITFPTLQTPLPNQSGLGTEVSVTWAYSGAETETVVSLREIGSGTFEAEITVGAGVREAQFNNVPAGLLLQVEVGVDSGTGSRSSTCLYLSTGPRGDTDGDGAVGGDDLLAIAGFWRASPYPASVEEEPLSGFVLDLDGNERIDEKDLLLMLELAQ